MIKKNFKPYWQTGSSGSFIFSLPFLNKQKEKKRKCRVYCRHQARNKGSLGSKDSNSLMVFRKAFLKTVFGVRVTGCMPFF